MVSADTSKSGSYPPSHSWAGCPIQSLSCRVIKAPRQNKFSSVRFSRSVVSNSLKYHGLQHTRPPCSSPTPGVFSNSCPFNRWCHPTISSSVIPFPSCLQSFPASGSFQMSQFFTLDGQSTGVSAATSTLPKNIQDLFPLGWTGWISLQSKGLSRVFSNNAVQKHQFFGAQLSFWSNSHIYSRLWENHSFDYMDFFVGKVMSLLFNMLSRLVTAFPPRNNHLLISWLQSPSAMILEPKKIKSVTVSIVSPPICHEVMGLDAMISVFWMLNFKSIFHSPLSHSSRGSLVLGFLPYGWCHLHIWGYWYFSWQSWFQLMLQLVWHFVWCILHIS